LDRLAAEYAALEQVDKPTAVERLIAHLKSD
jgi:CarD family transcriptional regulator